MLSKEQFKVKLDNLVSRAVFIPCGEAIRRFDELCAAYNEVVEALGNQPVEFVPFDLERAKSGAPIQYLPTHADIWYDCHFVGMTVQGSAVIQATHASNTVVFEHPLSNLRMTPPEMRTVYINVYPASVGNTHEIAYHSEKRAREVAGEGAVHVAYPVKIPVVK
jgi:hypothetical protein